MMTNSDPEGQIFLSGSHTTNGLIFMLTIKHRIFILKRLPEVHKYAEMRHDVMT